MEFKNLQQEANEVKELYRQVETKRYGKAWDEKDVALGFVGDVGDLMKLVIAKSGKRDIEDVDEKLAHELSDCLWAILVLANHYNIDLESEFMNTMEQLKERIAQSK